MPSINSYTSVLCLCEYVEFDVVDKVDFTVQGAEKRWVISEEGLPGHVVLGQRVYKWSKHWPEPISETAGVR